MCYYLCLLSLFFFSHLPLVPHLRDAVPRLKASEPRLDLHRRALLLDAYGLVRLRLCGGEALALPLRGLAARSLALPLRLDARGRRALQLFLLLRRLCLQLPLDGQLRLPLLFIRLPRLASPELRLYLLRRHVLLRNHGLLLLKELLPCLLPALAAAVLRLYLRAGRRLLLRLPLRLQRRPLPLHAGDVLLRTLPARAPAALDLGGCVVLLLDECSLHGGRLLLLCGALCGGRLAALLAAPVALDLRGGAGLLVLHLLHTHVGRLLAAEAAAVLRLDLRGLALELGLAFLVGLLRLQELSVLQLEAGDA
eukprot:Rhum_TRINITY_DN2126_c0_g1::Rhum_TRINITY_DN2126_c0_g1_i1::g.6075::m.6075